MKHAKSGVKVFKLQDTIAVQYLFRQYASDFAVMTMHEKPS